MSMQAAKDRATSALEAVRDAINPVAAAARKKQEVTQQLRVSRRRDDLHWLMTSERGRRVVYQLLADCGHQGSTLGSDGLPSAVQEGKRVVAITLAQEIVILHADEWLLMLKEAVIDNLRA